MLQQSNRKQVLGRGLSALLDPEYLTNGAEDGPQTRRNEVVLPVNKLKAGRYQPRKYFNEEEIKALAASIKEVGILQPILVRYLSDGMYEIIAGERRWRAAKSVGLSEVPVIIKNFSDFKVFEAALIENVQRQDLSPIEEAAGYKKFMASFGYTQDQLGDKFGKSRSYVANSLRLLSLPDRVKAYIEDGKLSVGHARTLLGAEKPEELADTIIREKLNVRQAERLVKQAGTVGGNKGDSIAGRDEDLIKLEKLLKDVFSTKVRINVAGQKGEIVIHFDSLQKLDEIISGLTDK